MGVITLAGAAIPISQAWVTKLIIDAVVGSLRRGETARQGLTAALPALLAELALVVAGSAIAEFRILAEGFIDSKLGQSITTKIIRKALTLEIRCFEDDKFYDKMKVAMQQSKPRAIGLINSVFSLAQNILVLASMLALLLAFNAWIAVLFFATAIPAFIFQRHHSSLRYQLQIRRTPEMRLMTYFENLLTSDSSAKEVQVFALGEPLLKRHAETFQRIFDENAELSISHSIKGFGWGMLSALAYYACYAWIIALTVAGKGTVGSMTLYLTMFRGSQATLRGILADLNRLYENGLFLDTLFDFLSMQSSVPLLDASTRPAEDPTRGVEFRNVWFQYPGQSAWALKDVSFEIGPNEKLALVGENGAGKTSLIKLLLRLYEPTRGEIFFRGVNLRHFKPPEFQRRVGAIFQDYVRYHVTLRENIGFGEIEDVEILERVVAAAQKSGASEIAQSFPEKYEAKMGRWFSRGHEVSGGQWQKIALGRAFMRQGDILVFDEPTAALDAAAEHELFQRLRVISENRIALLVSHRFSTVRTADRIAVLEAGCIKELGSHDQLVAQGGIYARLFDLQAQGYR